MSKRQMLLAKEFAGVAGLPSYSTLTKARSKSVDKRFVVPPHVIDDKGRAVYSRDVLKAFLILTDRGDPEAIDDL